MKRFITDNYGQKYRVNVLENSNDLFHTELRQRTDYVGEAKCMLRQDTMELSDIRIRDDADPPESTIEYIVKSAAKSKTDTRSYRRRGLGTALLEFVVAYARKKQLKRICGSIVQKDIVRTPNLVGWYEKRGFKKGPPYPGCIREAVAWIHLELN